MQGTDRAHPQKIEILFFIVRVSNLLLDKFPISIAKIMSLFPPPTETLYVALDNPFEDFYSDEDQLYDEFLEEHASQTAALSKHRELTLEDCAATDEKFRQWKISKSKTAQKWGHDMIKKIEDFQQTLIVRTHPFKKYLSGKSVSWDAQDHFRSIPSIDDEMEGKYNKSVPSTEAAEVKGRTKALPIEAVESNKSSFEPRPHKMNSMRKNAQELFGEICPDLEQIFWKTIKEGQGLPDASFF